MEKPAGKTVLTMGASQGIGEGIAGTLARHGANLILLNISDETEKLADELAGRGYRCTIVYADVRDFASAKEAATHAKQIEDKIDILMSNTGVCCLGNSLDMSDEDRDSRVDISTKGVWNVTKAILPEMIARRDGRIMMTSSVTGDMVADPGETAYVLSKAAIIGLARSPAVEYAQSGICVSVICSGYVRTPMAGSTARQSSPEGPEFVLAEMAKAIPVRRLACPLEVSELVVFLVSDEPSCLTGT